MAVYPRHEGTEEPFGVFVRMFGHNFNDHVLSARASSPPEPASASSPSIVDRRRRSDNLQSNPARLVFAEAAHRQIAEHEAVAGIGGLVIKRSLDFEPLECNPRHAIWLREWVHILLLAAVDTGTKQTHAIGLDDLVCVQQDFHLADAGLRREIELG